MRNVCLMGKEVVVIRPLFVIFPSLIFISAKQYGHLVIWSFRHFVIFHFVKRLSFVLKFRQAISPPD